MTDAPATAKPAPTPPNQHGEAAAKLNEYGEDALCHDILDGVTLTAIAANVGVSIGSLIFWRDADPERSARAREARTRRAELWDELAVTEIRDAKDRLGFDKAREIAHHYRWRAAKIDPNGYGERSTVDLNATLTLEQLVVQSLEKK